MNVQENIDAYVASFPGWRGEILFKLQKIVLGTDPDIAVAWKWDCPVFTKGGNVCALCAFKDHVKINFFKGAQIEDPQKLFNSGLDAKNTRAIDFFEGDEIDEVRLREIITKAVALNVK